MAAYLYADISVLSYTFIPLLTELWLERPPQSFSIRPLWHIRKEYRSDKIWIIIGYLNERQKEINEYLKENQPLKISDLAKNLKI